MVKALVTGCAGFIGSHLTDYLLRKGHHVVGIDRFSDYYPRATKELNLSWAAEQEHFKLIEQDILSMQTFPDVEYVFHMAAQPGVRGSWGTNFSIYLRNNVEATQKLLEWYAASHLTKFIYSSSSSVYGNAGLPMQEDVRPLPVSPYGVTKLAAENLCYLYWKNYALPIVSLRYFSVYGSRQRPDMAIHKFVSAIKQHEKITIYGDGRQRRDFTYVTDVVNAAMLAAGSEVVGEVFNIGGGSTTSVNDLIARIEGITGERAHVQHVQQQRGDVIETLADISRARELLGWSPVIDLDRGLKEYIESR